MYCMLSSAKRLSLFILEALAFQVLWRNRQASLLELLTTGLKERLFHRWTVISRLIQMCPLHMYSCFVCQPYTSNWKNKKEKLRTQPCFSDMSPDSGRGKQKRTAGHARQPHLTLAGASRSLLLRLRLQARVSRFAESSFYWSEQKVALLFSWTSSSPAWCRLPRPRSHPGEPVANF